MTHKRNRPKKEFYVRRTAPSRAGRYLFERDGKFGWGPKRIATRFRGSLDAERAMRLQWTWNGPKMGLVHA